MVGVASVCQTVLSHLRRCSQERVWNLLAFIHTCPYISTIAYLHTEGDPYTCMPNGCWMYMYKPENFALLAIIVSF